MRATGTDGRDGDARETAAVPRAVGVAAAGAFPLVVFSALNAIPGAVPVLALAAFAATALGGSAISLAATRPKTVPRSDSAREEALSDALFIARDEVQRLRAERDALADLIVDYDDEGRVIFANDAFCKDYGADPVGRLLAELRPVGDGDRHDGQSYVTRIGSGAPACPRVIAWQDSRVAAAGDSPGFTRAIGRDVTRFVAAADALGRARDAAEDASRAKARFLASMSHEVRTPLNGILGLANLLLDDELTPAQRNHIHSIRQSGQSLAALIDEVLDFSRIEAGRIDLIEEDADPAACVREVVELLAVRAHAKGIGLAAHVSQQMPAVLTLDAKRVKQILTNLVANAVRFTEAGAVTVEAGWTRAGRSRTGELVLCVRDTGSGIAASDQQRIFAEYEQSGSGVGGTGLGLAIVQRIVAAMGGEIALQSEIGTGSAFTVRLPCKMVREAEPAQRPLAGLRIAIQLACVPERDCLRRMCTGLGAQVVAMSEAPGLVLCAANETPPPAGVPALALLTLTDRPDPQAIRARGFGGYLTRPVRAESLVARIAALKAAPQAAGAPALAAEDRLPRASRPLRILVAEDDPVSAMLMVATLQRMGHEVVHAGDGAAALSRLMDDGAGFDAALLDIHLPGRTGLEIAREVSARPDAPALIAVTANAFAEDRAATSAAGFALHLAKPVDPHRLAAVLTALPTRAQRRARRA